MQEPSAKGRVTQRALLTSSIVLAVAWACAVGGASFAAIELTSMFARRSSDTLRAVGFFLLFVMSLLLIAATRAVITITGRSRDEVLRSLLPGDALGEFVRRAARDTLAGRPAGKAGAAPGAGGLITVKSGEITGPDGGYTSATAVGRRRSTAAVGVGVASGGNLTAEDGSVKGAPGRGGSVTSGRGAGFLSRQFKGREDGEMWDVYRMDEKAAVVTVAMPQVSLALRRRRLWGG